MMYRALGGQIYVGYQGTLMYVRDASFFYIGIVLACFILCWIVFRLCKIRRQGMPLFVANCAPVVVLVFEPVAMLIGATMFAVGFLIGRGAGQELLPHTFGIRAATTVFGWFYFVVWQWNVWLAGYSTAIVALTSIVFGLLMGCFWDQMRSRSQRVD